MTSSSPSTPWSSLRPSVVVHLLDFNLRPSRTLHPERATLLPGAGAAASHPVGSHPAVQRALHRRWSAWLLASLAEQRAPVLDGRLPSLPLALAAPGQLRPLARDLGLALLGPALRRLVLREPVLAARAVLGETGLGWALGEASGLHPGLPDAGDWLQSRADAAAAADALGLGLLSQSWQDQPDALRLRADWKLPPSACTAPLREASRLTPGEARSLALRHLRKLDPSWMSGFPGRH